MTHYQLNILSCLVFATTLINHSIAFLQPYTFASQKGSILPTTTTTTTTSLFVSTPIPRIQESTLQELNSNGYVVIKNFISSNLVTDLRNDVTSLRSSNKFNIAKIGQDSTNKLNTNIRVAETCFLGESKLQDVPNESRSTLYSILEQLRIDLSGNTIFDENDSNGNLVKAAPALDKTLSELLYAFYPKGGFYRRHTDAVQNSASVLRSYSLLLYLNKDWKESDGGCLRIHLDSGGDFLPDGEEPNFVDVQPEGGTLVLFKSDQIPHEVLDTNSERTAVVGWLNRPYTTADISSIASEEDKVRGVMLMVASALVTVGVVSIITG